MTTLPDLADLKRWLRVEHNDDDLLLQALLSAAIGALEEETSLCFEARAVTQRSLAGFPNAPTSMLKLWKGPVQSVTNVAYDPSGGGVEAALASFRLVEGERGGLLPAYGEAWPGTLPGPGTVRITYVAGFDAGELPDSLAQAVLMLSAFWYANRGDSGGGMPGWIRAMVAPFGIVGLA